MKPPAPLTFSSELIDIISERLAQGKRVRRVLPGAGRLHIDRKLPFLCLYRRPPEREDVGTDHFVLGQASYLIACGEEEHEAGLSELVRQITKTQLAEFGSFLLVEIWSGPEYPAEAAAAANGVGHGSTALAPHFRIHTPKCEELPTTVAVLAEALREISLPGPQATAEVRNGSIASPPDSISLLTTTEANELGCLMIGLEIAPVYRDPKNGEVYPGALQSLQRELSRALQKAFYEFMQVQTTHSAPHHQTLGRRTVVRAVWETDRQLAAISDAFDFLLAVTPVNTESAWEEFKNAKFGREPKFRYRLLSFDPDLLKRQLYNIRLESVEDPTIAYLFRDKRSELERQITMLDDRDTPRFLPGSLQVYGGVDTDLMNLSKEVLATCNRQSRDESTEREQVSAVHMAERARAEIDFYREQYPDMTAQVHVRDDIAGIMVSRGDLLISHHTTVAETRVRPLLEHEVGTHLLTYYNGRAQPMQQLHGGLAGYEELQEGLAVLAEYMVDGLTPSRLRLLAARVVAVCNLIDGASFVEVFKELRRQHGFSPRAAFTITMRVFRGGGLTKDAVYLRGLVSLLEYLNGGGTWEPLFVGKVAASHLPIIQELQWRKVLRPAPLQPRYMSDPGIPAKLQNLRDGLTVPDLVTPDK